MTRDPTRAPTGFHGAFVGPGDAGYDEERLGPIRQYDRRPAAIARCASADDVPLALAHAREHGLEVAVRSGGHSVPGYSIVDGALVIDLGDLKGLHVDPAVGRARVQPGVLAGEALPPMVERGWVAISGSEPQPSLVGLAIHGGRGLLSRRHGWASDGILAARMVLADGTAITVSEDEHPDLLFGLRGAGSNFGIVTELELELVPIPGQVLAGKLIYGHESLRTVLPGLLEALDDGLSDGLGVMLTFFVGERVGEPLLELKLVHLDEPAAAAGDIERIRALGEPLDGEIAPVSFADFILSSEEPPLDRFEWAEQGTELGGTELAEALMREAERLPAGGDPELPNHYLLVEPLGPGFLRDSGLPTAVPRRRGASVAFFAAWADPARDEELIGWAHKGAAHLRKAGVGDGVPILNYNSVTGPEGVRCAYGEDAYRRLQDLKATYDPGNVFRHNHNVEPEPGRG